MLTARSGGAPNAPRAIALRPPGRLTTPRPVRRGKRCMNIQGMLSREFLRVVEDAAVACARTMGCGDRKGSDGVAVEAMRKAMDTLHMRGTVVIMTTVP